MSPKRKNNKVAPVEGLVEAITDTETSSVEFVKPLVDETRKELTAPETDLTSPKAAQEALSALQETRSKAGKLPESSRAAQRAP